MRGNKGRIAAGLGLAVVGFGVAAAAMPARYREALYKHRRHAQGLPVSDLGRARGEPAWLGRGAGRGAGGDRHGLARGVPAEKEGARVAEALGGVGAARAAVVYFEVARGAVQVREGERHADQDGGALDRDRSGAGDGG